MENKIKNSLPKIIDACKNHQVEAVYLFGSSLNKNFNSKSDYDFLVRFSDKIELLNYADNYFSLLENLKTILKRKVDLVSEKSLKNPILINEINRTKVPIYE